MMKRSVLLACLVAGFAAWPAYARAQYDDSGWWPDTWPAELDVLRERSYTCAMTTRIHEDIYSIPFESAEEFRRLWPILRGLASPGAPVTLKRMGTTTGKLPGWDFSGPMVQIYAPTHGITGTMPWRDNEGRLITNERLELAIRTGAGATLTEAELSVLDADSIADGRTLTTDGELMNELEARGEILRTYAPWPEHLYDENGALPEYIQSETVDGKLRWRSADEVERPGFLNRCRVEIVLYVDGDVIDPDALNLPPTMVLVDER